MRPLGVLKCWEAMIDFPKIFGDFGVFSLMVTDGQTYGHMDGRTYGRTDPNIEMRGRI